MTVRCDAGNGNPARHQRPLITMERGQQLHPVAGIPRGCGMQAQVTLHTTLATLTYRPPSGYLPPAADMCGCAAFFADCLDSPGCLASGERCVLALHLVPARVRCARRVS